MLSHELGGAHAELFLEVLGKDFRRVVAKFIGYLCYLQLAFSQQLLCPFHPYNPYEFQRCFSGNFHHLLVEVAARDIQLRSQFFYGESDVIDVVFHNSNGFFHKLPVEGGNCETTGFYLDLLVEELVAFSDCSL